MESERQPAGLEIVRAYERAAVDEFVAAASAERARFESIIAEARARQHRARALVDARTSTQEVIIQAIDDLQRELASRRRTAEAQARRIIARAVEEAAQAFEGPSPQPLTAPVPRALTAERVVDLAAPDSGEGAEITTDAGSSSDQTGGGEGFDAYFSYLRGALVDEEPLGPESG